MTLVILALLVTATSFVVWQRSTSGLVRATRHGRLQQLLRVHGSVRARSSESHFSPIQGEAAKLLELADEGILVTEGDVIGRLDSYAVTQRLDEKRLGLEHKRGELKAENIALSLAGDATRREAASLQAQLEAARRDLAGYLELEAELDEMSLQNQLTEAEHLLADKEQKVADVGEFLAKGYASQAELGRAQRELAAALASVEEKRRRLRFFADVQRAQGEHERRRAVAELEDAIHKAQTQGRAEVELARARIATLGAEITEATAAITELETQLEGCTIRTKTSGIVVRGTVYDKTTGRRKVEVGDLVWSNVVLAQVTDLSQVDLEVEVPEEQMHALKAGLGATIWLAAEPLTALTGKVRTIGTMSSGGRASGPGQPSITVRIGVDQAPEWIRPGMTGRTEIVVGDYQDALVVPFSAVVFENEAAFVYGKRLWGAKKRQIEVLVVLDEGVVIGKGLGPGDKILLEAPAL